MRVWKGERVVRLSFKTRLPGFFLLERRKSLLGKPGYPFIVTIDGQTAVLQEDGEMEATPTYDQRGVGTPEGGEGRRNILEKRPRLAPGGHQVEIGLPEESYTSRFRVTLEERDSPCLLELKPVYRRARRVHPNFAYGVARLDPYGMQYPATE
jgi:hypothetical protein